MSFPAEYTYAKIKWRRKRETNNIERYDCAVYVGIGQSLKIY